jgi:hypothetical protein
MQRLVVSTLICLFLSGCANFKGGMPDLPFDAETELGIVKDKLKDEVSVKSYYAAPTPINRNKFISYRLIITNIEYLKYIKAMSAEEEQLHSATDVLIVSLNVAASAVNPVNTKTIISSLSAITAGTRLAIDKNTYFDKTMSALISAMNAQRKDVLTRIIKGTMSNLDGYPFEQALTDLNDYYLAGSLPGALTAIQKDAGGKEAQADAKITQLMATRDAAFVEPVVQNRVDTLLDRASKLPDASLFELVKAPPVTDAFVDSVVSARDPKKLRETDKNMALTILKMRIVLSQRDDKSLVAWEAAIKSM